MPRLPNRSAAGSLLVAPEPSDRSSCRVNLNERVKMNKNVLRVALAAVFAGTSPNALAEPVNYEMNLRTSSGMGTGGAGGMLGMMMGQGGGVTKTMDLRLTNPSDIPAGHHAEHTVPEAMRFGPVLPLKGQRRGTDESGSGEEPDGKLLVYWGCSATVAAGQPEVIDFRAMGNRLPPEVAAMARHGRRGEAGGDSGDTLPPRTLGWPHGDSGLSGIPAESSAVGDHVVKATFMQREIHYTLDKEMDFLEAMNVKATDADLKAAIPLKWDALARARGYNLHAVGAVGEKEMVIWMAAKNKNPMLPGTQNSCTIPAGIFQKAEGAMTIAEAVGPSKSFSYPPQKPDEKKPLIWAATIRVSGFDYLMLGMEEMAKGAAGDAAADSVVPGGGALIKSIKGVFGQ